MSGILYRIYKRLPSLGECQKILVSQPVIVRNRLSSERYREQTQYISPTGIELIEAEWYIYVYIYVSNLTIIGSDNGLSPGRHQAIIWTSAGILLSVPLRTNFCEILIAILTFSFKKMPYKVSSAKWQPFCLGLNVLSRNWWPCPWPSKSFGHSIWKSYIIILLRFTKLWQRSFYMDFVNDLDIYFQGYWGFFWCVWLWVN